MKKLVLFALSAVLTVSLSARENPFEVTNAYEEEAAKIVELNEAKTKEAMEEAQYIKEMQQKMEKSASKKRAEEKKNSEKQVKKSVKPKKVEKTYTKKEVDYLIKKTEKKTKELVKKELKAKPVQVVYVKPRTNLENSKENQSKVIGVVKKQLLPFLYVEYSDDQVVLTTKYKIMKKFTNEKDNKLAMDFKGKVVFNTLKENMDTKNFKVLSLGNHESEGFFRVVVQFTNKISSYGFNTNGDTIVITPNVK